MPLELQSSLKGEIRILEDYGDRLVVEVCAIHAGRTLNHTIYSAEELSKAVSSFTEPYYKPVLKHHFMWDDSIGRTLDARFVQTCKHGLPAVVTVSEILDQESIEKVKDGRYSQISIGCMAEDILCSVCGNSFITEEPPWDHEHRRGKKYDGVVAGYSLVGITFDEWSFVNQPADVNAGVVKILPSHSGFPSSKENITREIVSEVIESKKGGEATNMDVKKLEAMLEESKESIAELNKSVEQLTKEKASLEEKNSSLAKSNESLQVEVETLTEAKKELGENLSDQHGVNEALTADLQLSLAERLVDYKTALGQLGMDEREEAVESYKSRTLESLKDSVFDAFTEWSKLAYEMPDVDRPGSVKTGEEGVSVEGQENKGSDTEKPNPFVALFSGLNRK